MTLLTQALYHARRVAGICVGHAITNLFPSIWSSLAAATRAKQIVVQLVVSCCFCAIEDRHGCSLQSYDNSAIVLICKDVAAQAIFLPTKVLGIVKPTSHLLPFSCAMLMSVSVVRHLRKAHDRFFVRNVRARYLIVRPGRGRQGRSRPMNLSMLE